MTLNALQALDICSQWERDETFANTACVAAVLEYMSNAVDKYRRETSTWQTDL